MSDLSVTWGSARKLPPRILQQVFRFRADIFDRKLGWVRSNGDAEIDFFDVIHPFYVVCTDRANTVVGAVRLLPTTGPTMLRDVFPQLLGRHELPASDLMWEASRFFALGRAPHQPFTHVAARLFEGIFACGLEQGWSSVVAVSDVRLERYVRSLGIEVYRFTEPLMIGSTRTMAGWAAVTEEHRARASRAGYSTLVQDEAA